MTWLKSIAIALVVLAGSPALAQEPLTMPEVQIVIAPGITGWTIATVYPTKVDHSLTQARLRRLRLMANWPLDGLTFEDRALDSQSAAVANPKQVQGAARPIMSSATVETTANLVDFRTGTLVLEPFLVGFRDLKRINVTYLVPGKFVFQGLRQFSDNRLSVSLSGGEGNFTYQVTLKDHQFDRLNLPLQDAPRQETAPAVTNTSSPSRGLLPGIGLVALIALGIGGIVYAVTQRFSHRQ